MAKTKKAKTKVTSEWKTLFEDIRKRNRKKLEKRLFELAAAYHITKDVSRSFDLQKCLKALIDRIADLMSVEIVSVMLMDKHQQELVLKLAKGLDSKIAEGARVKPGQGIAGWIAQTGEPLLIKDISKDSRFMKRGGKYSTDSLLSVPLKVQNKVIGVINVNNKTPKKVFAEEDLDMLRTIADLTAIIIESAQLQQEMKTRDRGRVEFISNISHELRTPLSSIKESVCLILDGLTGKTSEDQKRFLIMAKQNVDRLAHLLDEILDLAKAESKISIMERSLFDIAGLVGVVINSLKPLAKKKNIAFKEKLPDNKVNMWGDSEKLAEVITNLLGNAIKYNNKGGGVNITLEEKDDTIKIEVSDTGIGIPKEELDKIFDRFYRVDRHAKAEVSGTGIGLSIARTIVEKHGGKILVTYRIGKGSRFTVTLPKDLRAEKRRKG